MQLFRCNSQNYVVRSHCSLKTSSFLLVWKLPRTAVVLVYRNEDFAVGVISFVALSIIYDDVYVIC